MPSNSALDGVSVIAFDADDTLWHSESYFVVTENRFRALLAPWCSPEEAGERLLERERANLAVFGYGIKGFTLSMIETAVEASEGIIPAHAIQQIIGWGKEMLEHPVDLLPGVPAVLDAASEQHRLALITKGDLFHQESKIAESGLAERFESIDVLAEKDVGSYRKVVERLGCAPSEFCMVGNSVRSDILPVIEMGGHAIHIPYEHTWGHEIVEGSASNGTSADQAWVELASMTALIDLLAPTP